ncbi:Ger(x)C family spore germination protein [Bacillus xiapuensis]|uniref:Ger(X)C family spore germination protein n=1 Tax=Bacillus xiapuensis TaxID=2014075 RepID=A0ABU6N7Z5_9BACI|nr:Ger(x)C family spore germination protein [Bacillus xiapuensis]
MRKIIFFIIISSLLLTGCVGKKEPEGVLFITALGIDYKDGQFILYIQGLNFGNIAKQEGQVVEDLPPLIGYAKGKSIQIAFSKLEQITALPLHSGHIQTIFLSKNVIERKMPDFIELVGQTRLIRYNILVFGTEENMQNLMNTQSFFNFPQLFSVTYRPSDLIKNNYFLPILIYNQFISKYYRPVGTILIPSLKINKGNFSEGKKKSVAVINGEYMISQQQYKGWLDKQDLRGLKWFGKAKQDTVLMEGKDSEVVRIRNPKTKVVVIKGKTPSYKIFVKGNAILIDNVKNKKLRTIEKDLNKKIKNDILTTIKKGAENKTDVLNLSEKPYRLHLNTWDINTINDFNEQSIKDVKVNIQIKISAKHKI